VKALRPELLQWYGLFGAGLAWTGQLIVGFGVAYADCATRAASRWGLDVVSWEIVLMVVGLTFAVVAEAAAVNVLLATRRLHYEDAPPDGRRHFFAFGAALGNILFIVAILLSGIGVLSNAGCTPA
jgi:cell division protein FtsX